MIQLGKKWAFKHTNPSFWSLNTDCQYSCLFDNSLRFVRGTTFVCWAQTLQKGLELLRTVGE